MDEHDAALISFARDLVRIPSILGNENRVAERVLAEMRFIGFDRVELDSAGNAVGIVEGATAGPTVLFDAHMDTVGVFPRQAWTRDPFGAQMDAGRLYGRGSSDMKGALAAMVHAFAGLDRDLVAGQVVVAGTVGEETIEGAALRAVMQRFGGDYVVVGESSGLDLVRGGRGRAEMVVTTHGVPAHASTPELGVNAVRRMWTVAEEIERIPMPEHEFVGRGVICLTDIISIPHPAHSVVPSACRATYERRLVPGDTQEDVRVQMRAACERAGAPDTDVEFALTDFTSYTGVHWERPKWFAPWELPEDHELVVRALRGLSHQGLSPRITAYQFCTNAAYSAGHAGIPTIGFGPGYEEQAHIVDEYVQTEQLIAARGGYRRIAEELLCSVE